MTEFQKGQLVTVRAYSDEAWEPAIFERIEGKYFICRSLLNRNAWLERPWMKAKPAEDVWPDIFIGLDRGAADQAVQAVDQAIYALEMESALVQRLRRQIEWLCQELGHSDDLCPTLLMTAPCDHDCASCWEQASLKAVKEKPCP